MKLNPKILLLQLFIIQIRLKATNLLMEDIHYVWLVQHVLEWGTSFHLLMRFRTLLLIHHYKNKSGKHNGFQSMNLKCIKYCELEIS